MRIVILLVAIWTALAQSEDKTREIWDLGFREHRPQPANSHNASSVKKPESYRPSSSIVSNVPAGRGRQSANESSTAALGVTIWRLRHVTGSDESAARLLVQDSGSAKGTEYVPERIRPDDHLRVGDRVRLGIESPRNGFLYVLDRERFSDGTYGEPYVLFPVSNLSHGDNRVFPGRLIEIPGQRDPVPALKIEKRSSGYVGEELSVIVSPQRIPSMTVDRPDTPLPGNILLSWERESPTTVMRLDLVSDDAVWTSVEKSAGNDARILTQDDPMPQAIYVAPRATKGSLLVRISLEVD